MKKKNKRNKPIILEGIIYASRKEAARHYNINYSTLNARLARGWTVEEAFEIKKHEYYFFEDYDRIITLNGEEIKIGDACKKYNISKQYYRARCLLGWTPEQIFGLEYRDNNCTPVKIKNKSFPSIREACDYYKANYSTVINRVTRNGWNIEDAILTPATVTNNKGGKRKPITVNGKRFETIKLASDYYNLNYGTVKYQLRRGKSIEEVFLKKGNKNEKK